MKILRDSYCFVILRFDHSPHRTEVVFYNSTSVQYKLRSIIARTIPALIFELLIILTNLTQINNVVLGTLVFNERFNPTYYD